MFSRDLFERGTVHRFWKPRLGEGPNNSENECKAKQLQK